MNKNEHVATFTRETDVNQSLGSDKSGKIYRITHESGHINYAVSLFENGNLQSCQGDYISYGHAVQAVIEWIDNSEFFL